MYICIYTNPIVSIIFSCFFVLQAYKASKLQVGLFPFMGHYADILFAARSFDNASQLRDLCALHVLNHCLKSRDINTKHNSKIRLAEREKQAMPEYKDQVRLYVDTHNYF
jgi:hypothetical protein